MIPIRGAVVMLVTVVVAMACRGEKRSATPPGDSAVAGVPDSMMDPTSAAKDPGESSSVGVGDKRTVLFLGTSLTAGMGLDPDSAYPQQIQRKIDARALPYQSVNAGVSGETSAGLLRRLDWVLQNPAAVIVVETGANDGLRGQSVTATKATIGQILTRIKKERPEAHVVLAQMEAPTNLGPEYTRAFRAMFPDLAREYGVTLLPFLLDGVAGVEKMNQGDGIHPNDAGERVVTENVWRTLAPLLEKR